MSAATLAQETLARTIMAEVSAFFSSLPPCEVCEEITIDVPTSAEILCALLEPRELSDAAVRLARGQRARITRGVRNVAHAVIYTHEDGCLHVEGPASLVASFDVDG